ncbi:MAG: hypothetical protein PHF60_00235 [Candidatus ainarchaeum sp.]|nr:hypothetical protein [Candidatus ainarchaeum sp.]
MVEVQKDGKANGAAGARKSVKDTVVPRLQKVVGGELGEALAEGLVILEERGIAAEKSAEALGGSIDPIRTRAAAAVQLAEGAKSTAAKAVEEVEGVKRDAQDARETAAHSNSKAEQALGAASEACQTAQGAVDTANTAAEKVEEVASSTQTALDKTDRKVADGLKETDGRVDELAGKLRELGHAVDAFGKEVEKALGLAEKASADAEHATDLIATAGKLVEEVHTYTREAVEGANARIDTANREIAEVRTSISPPPPPRTAAPLGLDEVVRRAREGDKPTPRPGTDDLDEEEGVLAEFDEALGKGPIAKQALALAKGLELKYTDLVTAVTEAFAAIDQKIQLVALAAGLNEEEAKAIEDPSFKLGKKG